MMVWICCSRYECISQFRLPFGFQRLSLSVRALDSHFWEDMHKINQLVWWMWYIYKLMLLFVDVCRICPLHTQSSRNDSLDLVYATLLWVLTLSAELRQPSCYRIHSHTSRPFEGIQWFKTSLVRPRLSDEEAEGSYMCRPFSSRRLFFSACPPISITTIPTWQQFAGEIEINPDV